MRTALIDQKDLTDCIDTVGIDIETAKKKIRSLGHDFNLDGDIFEQCIDYGIEPYYDAIMKLKEDRDKSRKDARY